MRIFFMPDHISKIRWLISQLEIAYLQVLDYRINEETFLRLDRVTMRTFSDGFKTAVATLPLILLFTIGCAGSRVSKGECEFSTDCPANRICRDGRCLSTSDGSICAANERAVNGRCEPVICECQSDDDCGGDRCVDCACYARTCQDEQTRPCETVCGGDQICRNGVWLPCRQSEPERCGDSIDNDCDGDTDEDCACTDGQIRPCSNECGGGQEEVPTDNLATVQPLNRDQRFAAIKSTKTAMVNLMTAVDVRRRERCASVSQHVARAQRSVMALDSPIVLRNPRAMRSVMVSTTTATGILIIN